MYAGVFDLDAEIGYRRACVTVYEWLRTHPLLREHAADVSGETFDLNFLVEEGLLAQTVVGPDDAYRVVRFQHREFDRYTNRRDPVRNWRTEVTIERDGDAAWIATRQWFAGLESDVRTCGPPRFIKALWEERALSDLDILEPDCRRLETDAQADELSVLIADSDRDLPVVVLADGCPLNAERLAGTYLGLAHVVCVSRSARFRLVSALDGAVELNHGALVTVFPRVEGHLPTVSGAKFETIIGWHHNGREGPSAFAAWLHDEIGRALVVRLLNDPAHRSIQNAKTEGIHVRLDSLQPAEDAEEMLELANLERDLVKGENEDLQRQIGELTERATTYLDQKTRIDGLLQSERERNHRLQLDKTALRHALSRKAGEEQTVLSEAEIEALVGEQIVPDNIFEAVETAERVFQSYQVPVLMSDQARESAMEALAFRRPQEVQSALIRLGFKWNALRKSPGQRLSDAATVALQAPCTLFESETTLRLYGFQRDVRLANDDVVRLTKHLKLGSGGTDDAARIYFGDKNGELLIGHVGRHLDVANSQ